MDFNMCGVQKFWTCVHVDTRSSLLAAAAQKLATYHVGI